MKYLTITYICAKCRFAVRVRTVVPKGKERYALTYLQAIDSRKCFRCNQRASLEKPE